MARKQKAGLESLAVVAEELGIAIVEKGESQVSTELDLETIQKIETEVCYTENQLASAKEATAYLLNRYVSAQKAAAEIKKQHKRPEVACIQEEKELLDMKKNLLSGAVVVDGTHIPQQKNESALIKNIDLALKQIANGKALIAKFVAESYGFQTADEVFTLVKGE